MNTSTIVKTSTFVLGLALCAASAFAAGGAKQNLHLTHAVAINGTTLQPGDYKLEWDGTGPNAEVSIEQGKNVVAKVPAHVVTLPAKSLYSAALTKNNSDGSSSLIGARFEGQTTALELGEGVEMSTASK